MSDDKQTIKDLNQERYAQVASAYVTSATHAKGSELQRLIELAEPQPDWLVLDIATGGGHTARTFAPLVRQVIVTDLTHKMLVSARDNLVQSNCDNAMYTTADAENLPFPDHQFDLVTCRIAAHHFPDIARFVRDSARVLKPGGILLIQDHVVPENRKAARYVESFERLRDPSHVRALPESEWRATFTAAGLIVDHTERVSKRHDFNEWADRQNCPPAMKERLQVMLLRAPKPVIDWMKPEYAGTPYAKFSNDHIIIKGHRPPA